jgi:hypothetical protein
MARSLASKDAGLLVLRQEVAMRRQNPEPRLGPADWAVLTALTWLQRPLRMGRLDTPQANQITEMMILVIQATRARPSAEALWPSADEDMATGRATPESDGP